MRHRLFSFTFVVLGIFLTWSPRAALADRAQELLREVTEAVGGKENFYAKKDVEYVYVYRKEETGEMDLSVERYLFNGERSWGKYVYHQSFAKDIDAELVQVYDGDATGVFVEGKRIRDEKLAARADFLRKTNFYWFAMMYKLLDPGTIATYEGQEKVKGTTYDKVKLTFKAGVGDVSDIYLLYIHPRSKLVDRFLFTVMDFGRKDPLLMEVKYSEVDGLSLPLYRRFTSSNWKGEILSEKWNEEISLNLRFNNGFSEKDFSLK